MITAEEAKELTANWVTYELRELEPLIRQVAVKGNRLLRTLVYSKEIVDELVKQLENYGFTVEKEEVKNLYRTIETHVVLILRW